MEFKPKSADEIAKAEAERMEENLFPKGEYDFEVIKAEDAVSGRLSKTPGTRYIKLQLAVFKEDGTFRMVFGMLHPAMEAQLRHFCEIGGILNKYEAGTLSPMDCADVKGKVKLKKREAEGEYPAKNEIVDFVVPRSAEGVPAAMDAAGIPPGKPPEDDDVPF